MSKLKINGTHISFILIETSLSESLSKLTEQVENSLINCNNDSVYNNTSNVILLSCLNELRILQKVSGFSMESHQEMHYYKGRKLTLKMPLKMLHEKYMPINLFNNKTINSSIKAVSVSYRKKSLCDYYLLKVVCSGTFSLLLPEVFDFLNLEIIHQNCLFKSMNQPIEQLVSFQMNSHEINFKQAKHNKTTYTLIQL